MKNATVDETIVQRLLTSFVCDYEAGRDPDPERYEARCPSGESRHEFRRLLDEYMDLSELLPDHGRGQVGPYRIESELGRGGMAQVFEVWDTELNRSLAMKVSLDARLNADGSVPPGSESRVARFVQEAQITSQLRHPGIVPVHQLGIDSQGHIYFTMELIGQTTLLDIFQARREGSDEWTSAKVLGVLHKVCEAVAFAHSQSVVHRDLKPRNVMVGRFGEVYVLDWGLAKSLDHDSAASLGLFLRGDPSGSTLVTEPWSEADWPGPPPSLTRDGTVVGTPEYMAPERARGDTDADDKRTDVYSIGAILYEFLAGVPPYNEGKRITHEELLKRIDQEPPRPVEELAPAAPPELIAICQKAMARDPSWRYGSLIEVRDELQAFQEDRVVRAYATGPLVELKKWIRRNRAWAASAALAIVAGVVVLGAWQAVRAAEQRREGAERLTRLMEEKDTLWPIAGETVPQLEDWLAEAGALLRAGRDEGEGSRAALAGLGQAFALIERRRDRALTIDEHSVSGPDARALWHTACASIADPDGPYGGLAIEPQAGFLPLGPDRWTGLEEFADLQTGEPPARDPAGRLEITGESGLVFVLLPGGRARLSSLDDGDEGELREVAIAPFFLSKYEMTQGQWLRATGDNPSQFVPGSSFGGRSTDLTHPVEQVSWDDCAVLLRGLGFGLPTADEWEYAARAGAVTEYWTGERDTLDGQANLADQTLAQAGFPVYASSFWPELDDDFAWHSPVDAFPANAFGFHDVHGNVYEWCRDGCSLAEGVDLAGREFRAIRGGSWANSAPYLGFETRIGAIRQARRGSIGLRPARYLSPGN